MSEEIKEWKFALEMWFDNLDTPLYAYVYTVDGAFEVIDGIKNSSHAGENIYLFCITNYILWDITCDPWEEWKDPEGLPFNDVNSNRVLKQVIDSLPRLEIPESDLESRLDGYEIYSVDGFFNDEF